MCEHDGKKGHADEEEGREGDVGEVEGFGTKDDEGQGCERMTVTGEGIVEWVGGEETEGRSMEGVAALLTPA